MKTEGSPLAFEWDEAKAARNAAKHGVRFEVAANIFLDPGRADFDASRVGDGEERRKVVGMVQGRLFTIVYVMRGSARRLISARPSNAAEKRRDADR